MPTLCSHCSGPITGGGLRGRPAGGRPAAVYCCFGCLSLGEHALLTADTPRRPLSGPLVRFALALLVAGQSMAWGLALNLAPPTDPAVRFVLQGALLASSLVVLALLGPGLFGSAVREARQGRVTAEALFVVTLAGALAASLQSWLAGDGPVYFEVVAVLPVVFALGRLVGTRGKEHALRASRVWAESLATCRLANGRHVPVEAVQAGDLVEVRPGEAICVDGTIRDGVGFVSESAVTGEPFPVVRRPGDMLLAGGASHDATFRIEATAPGTARQVDRLLAAVELARHTPTPSQARADRFAAVFLPVLLAVALATFAGWTAVAGWRVGLFHAMSVLLVACPCALGLATPIVTWTVLARWAERGLVARTADIVERLARVQAVWFDKTGTLTEERFALADFVTAEGVDRPALLARLAAVQAHSPHPAARAFDGPTIARVASVRVVPGCGVVAEVDGRPLRVGTPTWLPTCESLAAGLRAGGHVVHVEEDGRPVAVAALAEGLRGTAADAVADLRRLGLAVGVLTGDGRASVLGLSAETGLLPDDKRRRVADGPPALFVGDGINDAGALATATVGVALASGTDVANGAASATLYHTDLRILPWAVDLARRADATIRVNLLRAGAYNVVGVAIAAAGLLHPLTAALLMAASSLWVAWSASSVGAGCEEAKNPHPPTPSPFPQSREGEGERTTVPKRIARLPSSVSSLPSSACHAVALALQGPLLAALAGASAGGLTATFAAVGVVVAVVWHRWQRMPHAVDMAIGMLTLGNLGMLAGWWADAGFAPLAEVQCAACAADWRLAVVSPWMWVGMLLGANAAMAWLTRRPHGRDALGWVAMYGGGNVGMLAGMVAGGWLAGQVPADSMGAALGMAFAGMTAGMVVGMWAGELAVQLVAYGWRLVR